MPSAVTSLTCSNTGASASSPPSDPTASSVCHDSSNEQISFSPSVMRMGVYGRSVKYTFSASR